MNFAVRKGCITSAYNCTRTNSTHDCNTSQYHTNHSSLIHKNIYRCGRIVIIHVRYKITKSCVLFKEVSPHKLQDPEDGRSKVFRNVGILPQHYTRS